MLFPVLVSCVPRHQDLASTLTAYHSPQPLTSTVLSCVVSRHQRRPSLSRTRNHSAVARWLLPSSTLAESWRSSLTCCSSTREISASLHRVCLGGRCVSDSSHSSTKTSPGTWRHRAKIRIWPSRYLLSTLKKSLRRWLKRPSRFGFPPCRCCGDGWHSPG